MTAPIDKIEKLIALGANDANEEEARTSARQACKLIREHKLLVREKEAWESLGVTKEDVEAAASRVRVARDINAARARSSPFGAQSVLNINRVYGKLGGPEQWREVDKRELDDESFDALQRHFERFGISFLRFVGGPGHPSLYNVELADSLLNTRGATLPQALRFATMIALHAEEFDKDYVDDYDSDFDDEPEKLR